MRARQIELAMLKGGQDVYIERKGIFTVHFFPHMELNKPFSTIDDATRVVISILSRSPSGVIIANQLLSTSRNNSRGQFNWTLLLSALLQGNRGGF